MRASFQKLSGRAGLHLATALLLTASVTPVALARTPHTSRHRLPGQRTEIVRPGTVKQVETGGSHQIPTLNFRASCRAAIAASQLMAGSSGRTDNACDRDEKAARVTLKKEWTTFSVAQKSMCLDLEQAGGSPSYVELLTCLEMGKAVAQLPKRTTSGQATQPTAGR